MHKLTLKQQRDALEEEVAQLRSESAALQFERDRLEGEVAELQGRFSLDDVNAAYERLRANMLRWGTETGTLWTLAGLHDDLSRILAGKWTEDQRIAVLDDAEPAGDGAPF